MPKNAWARRADKNQPAVVEAFRRYGWTVAHTFRTGNSFPDIVVAKASSTGKVVTISVEIKDDKKSLEKGQLKFFAEWPGLLIVARNPIKAVERCERIYAASEYDRAELTRGRMRTYRHQFETKHQ